MQIGDKHKDGNNLKHLARVKSENNKSLMFVSFFLRGEIQRINYIHYKRTYKILRIWIIN